MDNSFETILISFFIVPNYRIRNKQIEKRKLNKKITNSGFLLIIEREPYTFLDK